MSPCKALGNLWYQRFEFYPSRPPVWSGRKVCTDVVHEWLPKVSGEEGPVTSVWPGRTDVAFPSGEGKEQYCCADMAIVSWDAGKLVCLEKKKAPQDQMTEAREVGSKQSRKGLRNTELRFGLQQMSVTGGAPEPDLLLKEEVLGHARKWAGWTGRGGGWETDWDVLLCASFCMSVCSSLAFPEDLFCPRVWEVSN